ncbi:MAG: twin-arginine translocation signal domain-containing protein, partial [Lysobacteraceae bacterium]
MFLASVPNARFRQIVMKGSTMPDFDPNRRQLLKASTVAVGGVAVSSQLATPAQAAPAAQPAAPTTPSTMNI